MIEIAKVDCSGIFVVESNGILGGGTGMYVEIRDSRDVFCTECSGSGPFGVCMLTARPLKHGMMLRKAAQCWWSRSFLDQERFIWTKFRFFSNAAAFRGGMPQFSSFRPVR